MDVLNCLNQWEIFLSSTTWYIYHCEEIFAISSHVMLTNNIKSFWFKMALIRGYGNLFLVNIFETTPQLQLCCKFFHSIYKYPFDETLVGPDRTWRITLPATKIHNAPKADVCTFVLRTRRFRMLWMDQPRLGCSIMMRIVVLENVCEIPRLCW